MIVTVAIKLINILKDTRAPSERFGGNTENSSTRKPMITTNALKAMALPE
jgi:hypothetical protein